MTILCQPCEPLGKVLVKKWSRVSHGFYIKSGKWYCPCDKRVDYCCSVKCRNLSEQVDLKIGESMCEHNKQRFTCIDCSGSQVCEHNRMRSQCKPCGGRQICNTIDSVLFVYSVGVLKYVSIIYSVRSVRNVMEVKYASTIDSVRGANSVMEAKSANIINIVLLVKIAIHKVI